MIKKKRKSSRLGRFRGDGKGLSAVVSTLILILLVIVAIGIIWVAIRNTVSEGSKNVELGQFSYDLQIQSAYVSGTDVFVTVKRNTGGGELLGMKFIFSNETDSITIDKIGSLLELNSKAFTFTASEIPGIAGGDEVSVAPIYESGGEKTGGITDSVTISGNPPAGSCGDNQIQSPNINGFNEQCDGSNLGGQSCVGLGYPGGTLSCSACQLNTSQCSICGNGDVQDGEACDDGNLFEGDGCSSSCTIEFGYRCSGEPSVCFCFRAPCPI